MYKIYDHIDNTYIEAKTQQALVSKTEMRLTAVYRLVNGLIQSSLSRYTLHRDITPNNPTRKQPTEVFDLTDKVDISAESRRQLAIKIGVSPSMITDLFNKKLKKLHGRYVIGK